MGPIIKRAMIELSNNSVLTYTAATALEKALSNLDNVEKRHIMEWFQHAVREQNIKISNAKRKF